MNLEQAIRHFGSANKLAQALGIARQNITFWKTRGIPLVHQYQIEELSGGKVRRARK